MKRGLTAAIYVLAALIGVAAFAYPFLLPSLQAAAGAQPEMGSRLAATPLLTALLVVLCLGALLVEMQGEVVSTKTVAALGVLVAIASVLRFVETAVPGPGGFSPIFVPIILAGYVFGARFGFLTGALTLLVSALITGGVGPWLPYQMFVAAWMGFTAGWLPHWRRPRLELATLILFAGVWGLLFGLITNLYFWPFLLGDPATNWQPGTGLGSALSRYAAFYVATSLFWDVMRAAGNAVLMVALGLPAVRALSRFQERLQFVRVERGDYAPTSHAL